MIPFWILLGLGGTAIAFAARSSSSSPAGNHPAGSNSERVLGTSFHPSTVTANYGSWMIVTDGNGAQWGVYPVVGGYSAISEAYEGTSRFFSKELGFEDGKKCVLWSKTTSPYCILYDPAPRTGLAQLIDDYARGHRPRP